MNQFIVLAVLGAVFSVYLGTYHNKDIDAFVAVDPTQNETLSVESIIDGTRTLRSRYLNPLLSIVYEARFQTFQMPVGWDCRPLRVDEANLEVTLVCFGDQWGTPAHIHVMMEPPSLL